MKSILIVLVAIGINYFPSLGYAHDPNDAHNHSGNFGFSGTYSGNTEFKPDTLNYNKLRPRWNDSDYGHAGFLDHFFLFAISCHKYCPERSGTVGEFIPGKCWDERDYERCLYRTLSNSLRRPSEAPLS